MALCENLTAPNWLYHPGRKNYNKVPGILTFLYRIAYVSDIEAFSSMNALFKAIPESGLLTRPLGAFSLFFSELFIRALTDVFQIIVIIVLLHNPEHFNFRAQTDMAGHYASGFSAKESRVHV